MAFGDEIDQIDAGLTACELSLQAHGDIVHDDDPEVVRVPEMTRDEYVAYLARRDQSETGATWSELRSAMLRVALLYISAGDAERDRLRQILASRPLARSYVLDLIEEQSWLLGPSDDARALQLLAMLSAANMGYTPAVQSTTTDLYYHVAGLGLPIADLMRRVGDMSSRESVSVFKGQDLMSTQEFFTNFCPTREL